MARRITGEHTRVDEGSSHTVENLDRYFSALARIACSAERASPTGSSCSMMDFSCDLLRNVTKRQTIVLWGIAGSSA